MSITISISKEQAEAILVVAKEKRQRLAASISAGHTSAWNKHTFQRWHDLIEKLEDGLSPNQFDNFVA